MGSISSISRATPGSLTRKSSSDTFFLPFCFLCVTYTHKETHQHPTSVSDPGLPLSLGWTLQSHFSPVLAPFSTGKAHAP